MGILGKIFIDFNEREVRKLEKIADQVMALDEAMQDLTDDELKGKTKEFRERLKNGETLDDILVEALQTLQTFQVPLLLDSLEKFPQKSELSPWLQWWIS